MEKSVEKAINDIAVIKGIIERTQRDFSKISAFFVWIGVINLVKFIVEQLSYYFRNVNGYNSRLSVFLGRTGQLLPLIAYIICFILFYRMIKLRNNTISMGLLKVWGIILIGTRIFVFLYIFLLPSGNSDAINILWRCRELVEILPIIVILLVTGVLTQIKTISVVTGMYSILYFILFTGMQEVRYGMLGGRGTMISVSSVSIRIVMTAGMIILGLFLKKGVKNGNKFNTGSISDEA
ncbi:MAG: hypothetical protein ACI4DQ_06705 [Lachnospiraceae bacterium]